MIIPLTVWCILAVLVHAIIKCTDLSKQTVGISWGRTACTGTQWDSLGVGTPCGSLYLGVREWGGSLEAVLHLHSEDRYHSKVNKQKTNKKHAQQRKAFRTKLKQLRILFTTGQTEKKMHTKQDEGFPSSMKYWKLRNTHFWGGPSFQGHTLLGAANGINAWLPHSTLHSNVSDCWSTAHYPSNGARKSMFSYNKSDSSRIETSSNNTKTIFLTFCWIQIFSSNPSKLSGLWHLIFIQF